VTQKASCEAEKSAENAVFAAKCEQCISSALNQKAACEAAKAKCEAIEVFSTQLMPVSEIALREGMRAFGATTPRHVVIWEQLMDARTVLLTANTETVYALAHLNLKADGPTVIEAPPHMLGFLQDGLERYLADVGPLGADKRNRGKFLVLPPGFTGTFHEGYFVSRSPTYSVALALRGFQAEGNTDQAVGLIKQIKIYSLDSLAQRTCVCFLLDLPLRHAARSGRAASR
jgi:hypothetical protein